MKISRIIQGLLLSALILTASIKESYAFFFLPPMPWDVEVDFPANAGKIVSNVKAYLRQLQTIKSEIASQKLEVLKAGQKYLTKLTGVPSTSEGGKNKAPGRGVIKNDPTLGITQEGLDEEEVFNAMFRLFFVYPELKEGIDLPVLKTVYRKKAIEYKQDITMETYLMGKVTEEYLSVVEKTIARLDKCQKMGYDEGEMSSNCTFFGLQMVYIDPNKVNEGDPENSEEPGQIGADMNAYIVTVVYDKLLQIVENLTAMEAQFQATKQIDMVDPIMEGETQSSADEYIKSNFRFANSNKYEFANAAYLLSKRKRNRNCDTKDVNCPARNEEVADTLDPENTEVLKDLQVVENKVNEAMNIHNTKTRLWEYKSLYRKYLKSKEIHEKTLQVLKQSDLCAESFIRKYAADGVNASELWGKPSVANQHDQRTGVSREILEEYQKYITETILGTTEDCGDGYYEECPDGTEKDPEKVCPTDSRKYKCVEITETVVYDTGSSYGDSEEMTSGVNTSNFVVNPDTINDTDYLTDGTKANEVETENRKKAERPWLIGHKQVDELTREGKLVFKPWNDQKNLQYEYLRNKYRNIKMIIKSVDQGKASYKIAQSALQGYSDASSSKMAEVLKIVTSCKIPSEAVEDAYKDFCAREFPYKEGVGKYYRTYKDEEGKTQKAYCTISPNDDKGYIYAKKQKQNGGEITKTYDQRIHDTSTGSKMCDFTKQPVSEEAFSRLQETQRANDSCPGTWDFTIDFLVRNYLPAVVGGCQSTLDAQAQKFYSNAKEEKGRVVAGDKLSEVMGARVQSEENLKELAGKYNNRITQLRTELRNLLDSQKKGKDDVSKYTDLKNAEIQQLERSKQRVEAIKNELEELNNRKKQVSDKPEDVEAIEKKINALTDEKDYIEGKKTQMPSHYNEETNADQYFKTLASCNSTISSLNLKIEAEQRQLEIIQKEILRYTGDSNNEDDGNIGLIRETANEFAKKYIEQLEEEQKKIEAKNKEFEEMVETKNDGSEPERLINMNQRYCSKKGPFGICREHKYGVKYASDNLETSMVKVLYLSLGKENLKDVIKSTMNSMWFSDIAAVSNLLEKLGVPSKIVLADANVLNKFGIGINLPINSSITPLDLVKAIKDGMVEIAAKEVEDKIKEADKFIAEEITSAVNEVDALAKELKVSGENNEKAQESDILNIYDRKNYGPENDVLTAEEIDTILNTAEADENQPQIAPITKKHYELIKALRQPSTAKNGQILAAANIKLETLLGIPEYCKTERDETCTPYRSDDDYFVALPARGADRKVNDEDQNVGRDYLAPSKPLMNIAPLRESFYYGPLDYDDIPRSGNSPAISQLLNYKYEDEKVEYLPEVWRYLLARPNLRDDGKYMRTFVERSYETSKLKDYINSFDNGHYRTLISRAGVYPCILGDKVIDVRAASDKVSNMSFAYNSNSFSNLPHCQEISVYKNGVRHLLADFLPNKKDKNNPALQTTMDKTSETRYDNYSELGQFLQGNMKYRGLVSGINSYLLDKNNNSNNIARQRADTAAFKRNVFGSFLEVVNAENSAKKALEQNEREVQNSLADLCEQIHNHKYKVNNECTESTEECKNACVQFVFDLKGSKAIASSSEDNNYEIDCAKEEESIYEQFFCKLDELKEVALGKAKNEYASLKNNYTKSVLDNVKEYTDEIENYFAAFEKDKNEDAMMMPKATGASQEKAVKTAVQDRKAVREADEEGIIAMGNQSQSVAYCPVY